MRLAFSIESYLAYRHIFLIAIIVCVSANDLIRVSLAHRVLIVLAVLLIFRPCRKLHFNNLFTPCCSIGRRHLILNSHVNKINEQTHLFVIAVVWRD